MIARKRNQVESEAVPGGTRDAAPDTDAQITRLRNLGLSLTIALATLVAYAPALRSGFIWDDDTFLTENRLIHAPDGLRRFWFSTEPPDYFPLTSSMLWLEWRLWGKEHPGGYHTVNVLLHAISAILLWRLLLAMKIPGAWLAGLIFALHPVNVESAAWITERKNVLPMVFYLGALLSYLRFEQRRSWSWYGAALVLFLLGLLAKTSIVMLPLVLLGWAWWDRGRVTRQDLMRSAPFFLLSLVLGLVTVWYQTHRAIGEEIVRPEGLASRLAASGWAVWFYLYKAIWPLNLCFVYPRWDVDPKSPLSWLPLLALVGVFAALIGYRRRPAARALLAALGYYVLMLLPVLGFVDIYFMRYSLVADHWQYFALPGVIVLVAAGLALSWQRLARPYVVQAAAAALVLTLGTLTFLQTRAYADEETLWIDVIARNPSCWLGHNNLGGALQKAGRSEQALPHFVKAININPNYAEAHANLGVALQGVGRVDEAWAQLREALRLKPNYPEVQNNWGNALVRAGRREEALAYYQKSLELDPNQAEVHNNLAVALAGIGRLDDAVAHFEKAAALDPGEAEWQNNWGSALQQGERLSEAITHFQAALRLNPRYAEAHNNLGNALQGLGRLAAAVASHQEALRLKPNYAEAYNSLGVVLAKQGRYQEAIRQFERALELKSDYTQAGDNLRQVQALERGKLNEAAD